MTRPQAEKLLDTLYDYFYARVRYDQDDEGLGRPDDEREKAIEAMMLEIPHEIVTPAGENTISRGPIDCTRAIRGGA